MNRLFLAAAALVTAPVVGAVAGTHIGTEPLGDAADLSSTIGQHTADHRAYGDASPRTQARLPDHYAMETPEGRVEVAELVGRGPVNRRVAYDIEAETVDGYGFDYDYIEAAASVPAADTGYATWERRAAEPRAQTLRDNGLAEAQPAARYADSEQALPQPQTRGVRTIAANTSAPASSPQNAGTSRNIDVGQVLANQ